ncbi:MAG: ABC transporter transmembrane domain-containing protein [Candidatus Paracaedibacteraceae bacterium]|nr:ABC transporter transmembrane domain-containing protein [Candidatus Paracaedibacteraceae bacterium]
MRENSPYDGARNTTRPQNLDSMSNSIKKLSLFCRYAKPHKTRVIIAFLSVLGAGGIVLAFGTVIKAVIDQGFLFEKNIHLLATLGGIFAAVILLSLFSFGRCYFVSWLSERIIAAVRQDAFNHLLNLDMSYYEQVKQGELVSRLTTDTSLLQIVLGTSLPIALRNSVLLVGGLTLMIITSPKLAMYALTLVPVIIFPAMIFGQKIRSLSKKAQERLGDLSGFLNETILNIHTCQAFTHEEIDRQIFNEYTVNAFNAAVERSLQRSFLTSFVMAVSFGAIGILLWIGVSDVHSGDLTSGTLSAFLFYAILVAGTAGSFSEVFGDLKRASGAAERIIEVFRIKSTLFKPHARKMKHLPSQGTVAMHNVDFAYPTNTKQAALNHITFSVNPGERLAIVGASGSGKSTLFSLLMRFYEPQSGSIFIDGHDYRDLPLHELRHRIGIVPQEPALFSATLLENIMYGRPDATDKELFEAIKIAQLQDVIRQLPQGVHTYVGTRGVRLSGGQKQRVAIARAVLRNPRILLLDEATSALDAENERAVQEGLKYLTSTRTTLVIAHRLATVLHAEKIIVMDKGCIQAIGNHAELCEHNALYRRLATLQFADSLNLEPARHKI